jgi:catechol 2,3-dioxygenase-like lactoylglutathione lyase family enzyme
MITGVNHITLVVADLPRALAFYSDLLGMIPRAKGPHAAYLEAGSLWLCLELGTPSPSADDGHIALSCAPADFEALCSRLSDAPRWKINRSEGASLYLLDPDGHKLELHLGDLASRLAHYRTHAPESMTTL